MAEQCRECGASGRWGSCDELFMTLLALDHERKQPWGSWHTLNVACYLLQHPSQANGQTLGAQWAMVQAFRAGGLDAVRTKTERAVRQNNHLLRRRGPEAGAPPAMVTQPAITIEDVSVDGSFPSSGFEGRMEQWTSDVAAGRG